jgi:hypothetical protein
MEENQRRRRLRERWHRFAPGAIWSRWGWPLFMRRSATQWELPDEPLAIAAATIFYLSPPPGHGRGAILLPMGWIDAERHPGARDLPRLLAPARRAEAAITWRWDALPERGGAKWILRYAARASLPLSFEIAFDLPAHIPFLDAVCHAGELVLLTTAPPGWPGELGRGVPPSFPVPREQVGTLRQDEIRIRFPPDLTVRLESEVERWYGQQLTTPEDAPASTAVGWEEDWPYPDSEPFQMIGKGELLAQSSVALSIEAAGWMKIETAAGEEHLQALWLDCEARPDIITEVARIHAGKAVVGYGQWLHTQQHVVLSYSLTSGCAFTLVFDLLIYRRVLELIVHDGCVAMVFRSRAMVVPLAGHGEKQDVSPGLKVPVPVPRGMPGWLAGWRPPPS